MNLVYPPYTRFRYSTRVLEFSLLGVFTEMRDFALRLRSTCAFPGRLTRLDVKVVWTLQGDPVCRLDFDLVERQSPVRRRVASESRDYGKINAFVSLPFVILSRLKSKDLTML